jgi:MarR family transcriptional regulator, organic hydroperoxide resistance regulator
MVTITMYIDRMAPPFDPPPSMGYLLWRLAVKWRAQLDRELAPLGLTSAQYSVLASLRGLSGTGTQPSQRELADFAGLEPMFVSKLARALEQAGLVTRSSNPADPRALRLEITPRGLQTVTAARAMVLRLERERLAVIDGPAGPRATALSDTLRTLLREADHDEGQ